MPRGMEEGGVGMTDRIVYSCKDTYDEGTESLTFKKGTLSSVVLEKWWD